ncbi:unnamed protein product [Dibothriocephalus latus]|uniref:Uncharacterized protein n=1 Tax=Dibothriocephalus latus TaxID=60516 RepID=A0A3P7NWB8_DIBLA|nr:unnamed protein product [Dibothriocephalus latus]
MALPREPWPQFDPLFHRRLFHHVRGLYLDELSSFLFPGQAHNATPSPNGHLHKPNVKKSDSQPVLPPPTAVVALDYAIEEEAEEEDKKESEAAAPLCSSLQSSRASTVHAASICDPLLPDDWLYLPVLRHYLRSVATPQNSGDEHACNWSEDSSNVSPCQELNSILWRLSNSPRYRKLPGLPIFETGLVKLLNSTADSVAVGGTHAP